MTAGLVCGLVALVAGPWLARLTLSVPDRAERRWWPGRRASPARTAITTAVTVALAWLAARAAGAHADLPAFLALGLVGAPLIVIDVEHHRLPDRLVAAGYVGAVLGLGAAAAIDEQYGRAARAGEAALLVATVFVVTVLAVPDALGLGDVKLVGLLGAYLGWIGWSAVLAGLFVGFVLGAVVSLVLMAVGRATISTAVAFGPALIVGTLATAAFAS